MLKLTKKADYGLIALKHLAVNSGDVSSSAKAIAECYGIPLPLLANREVEITIETPIASRLFANLKSLVAELRSQPLRRLHLKIRRDERRFLICCHRISRSLLRKITSDDESTASRPISRGESQEIQPV